MKSIEDKLLGQLYCFCGGGDDNGSGADDGDTGDTGVSASVAAGGRGWGPSRGPNDRDESSNDDQDRRVQSTGSTTNFNIDRSQPSVVADVNGVQRTVYGTQENLDSAIASGDLNPVGNVQDNYTPGTQEASQAYNAVIADQEDALGFAPGAAAGPALAGIDTTDPFQTMQFGTPITAQAFSPVARAMSPFERTLAAASRPQTADEKLADLARTDRRAALQQYLDVNPNQSLSYANSYLNALVKADDRAAIPSSPEFDQRAYSPVDAVNIFDQFEQPIGANNPPTALDPSRPMTQIRAATPADLITQEARAAANQLLGPERSRPTADEIAAANARLDARTPGLQEAIAEGIMPANIEGQYGMQPTTTEVDAYDAAINAEIADQLGVDVYNPVTYGVSPTDQITQVSTGPITQQDYANLAAGRGAIQGDMGVINQAAQEVALETGVSPQQAAQATGIASINQMYDQALAPYTSAPGPIGMDQVRTDEINLERQQYEDYINTGKVGRDLASNEVVSFADFGGKELSSFKPGETVEERINQIANFTLNKDPRIASAAQQAIANTREDYPTGGGLVSQPTPERGPGAVPTRAGLNDIERAVAEEEAFRASQAATPSAADIAAGEQLVAEGQRLVDEANDPIFGRAAEQQADADQFMDVSAIDVTRPTNQELVAQGLRAAGLSESAIQRGIAPEGTLPGDEEQGAFLGENIVRDPRPQFENPLANVPYLSTVGEVGTGIANSLFRSTAQVDDMIDKGAQEITDENGFRIGAFDPRSKTVYSVAGESFNPALEPYYAQQREAEQARQDSGGDQIAAPTEETPAEETPEEYVGKQIVKPYQYQPRGPLSYAYTGLPSLAPQKLKPSYRAPKSFSPLFPVS